MKRIVEEPSTSIVPGSSTKRPRSTDSGGKDDTIALKMQLIPSDRNPGYNYAGLLIGPGGSNQRELTASAGGSVRISIIGKDEPYVVLKGRRSNVEKAERLIRELVEKCDSDAADREGMRQLGSINHPAMFSTWEITTLLDTESLSNQINSCETSVERPRKAPKVMDSKLRMTVPSWVMQNTLMLDGRDLLGKLAFYRPPFVFSCHLVI